jgi:hypothetical protein
VAGARGALLRAALAAVGGAPAPAWRRPPFLTLMKVPLVLVSVTSQGSPWGDAAGGRVKKGGPVAAWVRHKQWKAANPFSNGGQRQVAPPLPLLGNRHRCIHSLEHVFMCIANLRCARRGTLPTML